MQRVLDDGIEASDRARSIARMEVLAVGMWRKPDPAAIEPLTECAAFFHAQGDRLTEAKARSGIGLLHLLKDPPDFDAADESLQRALDLAESLNDPVGGVIVGLMIGRAYLMRGDVPNASETLDASISVSRNIGDRLLIASALNARGWAAILAEDLRTADQYFREELLIASTIGHEPGIGYALEGLFAVSSGHSDIERAGQLLGAADSIRQRKGNSAAATLSFHGKLIQQIEQSAHAAQFENGRNAGRSLDIAAAVELALS